MRFQIGILITLIVIFTNTKCHLLTEKFSWRDLKFAWPTEDIRQEALLNGKYVPSNNLPLAFDVWRDKIFLTVPRCVREGNSIVIYDNLKYYKLFFPSISFTNSLICLCSLSVLYSCLVAIDCTNVMKMEEWRCEHFELH